MPNGAPREPWPGPDLSRIVPAPALWRSVHRGGRVRHGALPTVPPCAPEVGDTHPPRLARTRAWAQAVPWCGYPTPPRRCRVCSSAVSLCQGASGRSARDSCWSSAAPAGVRASVEPSASRHRRRGMLWRPSPSALRSLAWLLLVSRRSRRLGGDAELTARSVLLRGVAGGSPRPEFRLLDGEGDPG